MATAKDVILFYLMDQTDSEGLGEPILKELMYLCLVVCMLVKVETTVGSRFIDLNTCTISGLIRMWRVNRACISMIGLPQRRLQA